MKLKKPFTKFFKCYPSLYSSIGSKLAWYHRGHGFKSWQGRYWSQKHTQSGNTHSLEFDVYAVKQSALCSLYLRKHTTIEDYEYWFWTRFGHCQLTLRLVSLKSECGTKTGVQLPSSKFVLRCKILYMIGPNSRSNWHFLIGLNTTSVLEPAQRINYFFSP